MAGVSFGGGGGTMSGTAIKSALEELSQPLRDALLIPDGHFSGFSVSNNGTDATNDIDVGAGVLRTSSGNVIRFTDTITKRLDASFSAGTGNGGLATGAKAADTTYYLFVCVDTADSSNPVVDWYFDTDRDGANLPAGYDDKQYIWTVRTKADSSIIPFNQRGNECVLKEPYEFLVDSSITTEQVETGSAPAPPYSICRVTILDSLNAGTSGAVWAIDGDASITLAGGSVTSAERAIAWLAESGTAADRAAKGDLEVNGSSQFKYAGAEPTGTLTLTFTIWGWTDTKRKAG